MYLVSATKKRGCTRAIEDAASLQGARRLREQLEDNIIEANQLVATDLHLQILHQIITRITMY